LHEHRATDILAALHQAPHSARALVGVLWTDLPSDVLFLGVCEVLAHLDLLSDRHEIRAEATDGVVRNRPNAPRRAVA
jgi:hypothetical protein